jgi:1,4-dihydroxy-2-naphthoate octaprenyltransferase
MPESPSSLPRSAAVARQAGEPLPGAYPNAAVASLLATRPAFLSVTLAGVLVGLSGSYFDLGRIDAWAALVTLVLALAVHAGVNVINDYYDAINGTDDANTERIYPFTGGSRFIQNDVLSRAATARLGRTLLAFSVGGGILLTYHAGIGLLWIGLVGVLVGWAYSAPPLALNSRGLGELAVAMGFAAIVVGTDYVQRHTWDSTPFAAGMSYALFVTNLLYINQFPDRSADRAAGKLHWVARLPPVRARWGYVLIAAAAGSTLISGVARGCLPPGALVGLIAWLPAGFAARELFRHCESPRRLAGAIKATIVAAMMNGLGVSAALVLAR